MSLGRTLGASLIVSLVACGGDDPNMPVVPPPAPPPPVASFDFLDGTWNVTSRHLGANGFATAEAVSVIQSSIGGRVRKERWIGPREGRTTEVWTMYGRSDRAGQWLVMRADGDRGTFDVLEGTFAGGRGTFTSRSDTRPDAGLDRVSFDSVSTDRFLWTAERSADGGATWTTWWTMEYRRAAGAVQMPVAPDPAPGCAAEPYHRFDFWLGEWDIGSANSSIRRLLGGCLIDENWFGGETGTSFNMYDPRSERWTQVWLDTNGNTLFIQGGLEAASMVMQGPRTNPSNRITWTPLANGTVRQHGEASTDGGASWTTLYDLIYVRR